jgi:sulfur carrier protein
LATYLESFGVNMQHVAVGYNGEVLKKEEFPQVKLQDGDVLEIVRPVGGG